MEFDADGLLLKYAGVIIRLFPFSVIELSRCSFSSSTVSLAIGLSDIRLLNSMRLLMLPIESIDALLPWLFVARTKPL